MSFCKPALIIEQHRAAQLVVAMDPSGDYEVTAFKQGQRVFYAIGSGEDAVQRAVASAFVQLRLGSCAKYAPSQP